MNELKPCPFCGMDAGIERITDYENGEIRYRAYCHGCYGETNDFSEKKAAIEAWNRRVSDDD